jgi:pyruvate/2-oxoglutarate dehydrogenase complex dihydrolipoamide acyltransferase (E2) component
MDVKVPDIGDFTDVPVIEIHVKAGDTVNAEDPLVTLESDKATMDVPAPSPGTVQEVLVNLNDTVSEGSTLLTLEETGATGDEPSAGGAGAGDASADPDSGSGPEAAEASPVAAAGPAADDTPSEGTDPAEAIDLERVRELWPSVVERLRESGSELLSTLLEAARPVALDVEDAVLKVGFPPAAAFNKRKAEAAEARDRFAEALRATVGERLRPVFVLLEPDDEQAVPEAEILSPEELIERFKSEFDAEEVEVSEEAKQAEPREATG